MSDEPKYEIDPDPPLHLVEAAKAFRRIMQLRHPEYTWVVEISKEPYPDDGPSNDS